MIQGVPNIITKVLKTGKWTEEKVRERLTTEEVRVM